MKNIFNVLLIFTLFYQSGIKAQCDLPVNDKGEYEIIEIVKLDSNYSVSKIYNSALLSMATIFHSASDVIDVKNEDEGYIIGKFSIASEPFNAKKFMSYFNFFIRLDMKEDRYKILVTYVDHIAISTETSYSVTNPITSDKSDKPLYLPSSLWNKQRCKANNDVVLTIENLKQMIVENLIQEVW